MDRVEDNAFSLYGHALVQEPLSQGSWNFGILCHHHYIISLYDLCLEVEKKTFKDILHFHYITYGHALTQEPLPRDSWNL